MFFNRVDQLWNIDRLRDDRMSFNANSAFCFDCGDQPCLKDYWRAVQVTIGVNLFRYFGAVAPAHDKVEQNQIRFETARGLISLGGVVFLEHQIRAGSLEKDFYKVRGIGIIIDDENPACRYTS